MAISSVLSADQVNSLIQQASAAYQLPAGVLQAQEQPIQAQISALGKVQSALSSLQSALAGLADMQSLTQRTVTTSPTGIVQATVTNQAAIGIYTLTGVHQATAESLVSSGSASASGALGAGTLSISVGGGTAINIDIGSGSSSLSGIAAAIEAADAGVHATVLYDGSAYRLVLTSDQTGAANSFTVTGTGALAGLSYNSGASGLSETQSATNASFSLNGITITSGSNTIANVIPGLTLTIAGSGTTTVNVGQSVDALDQAAQGVVGALNTTLRTIQQLSGYSPTSGAGPLLGNVGLQILRSSLLNSINTPIGQNAGSPYATLSAIGFTVTSGGTITLDNSKFLSSAQSNYAAVASLLGNAGVSSNANVTVTNTGAALPGTYSVDVASNTGGSVVGSINGEAASGTGGFMMVTNTTSPLYGLTVGVSPGVTGSLGTLTISRGLFGSLSSFVNSALSSGTGSITGQISGLNTTIGKMNDQIADLQKQARAQTAALSAQFSIAEATLSQLQTVSNFLSTYFNLTSGGSGG